MKPGCARQTLLSGAGKLFRQVQPVKNIFDSFRKNLSYKDSSNKTYLQFKAGSRNSFIRKGLNRNHIAEQTTSFSNNSWTRGSPFSHFFLKHSQHLGKYSEKLLTPSSEIPYCVSNAVVVVLVVAAACIYLCPSNLRLPVYVKNALAHPDMTFRQGHHHTLQSLTFPPRCVCALVEKYFR